MCLVRLHPENIYQTYDHIPVPFLDKEVDDLFQQRLELLQNGTDNHH